MTEKGRIQLPLISSDLSATLRPPPRFRSKLSRTRRAGSVFVRRGERCMPALGLGVVLARGQASRPEEVALERPTPHPSRAMR